jgi:acetyl esterase
MEKPLRGMMGHVDPKTRALLDMMAALRTEPLSAITARQIRAMRAAGRSLLNPPTASIAVTRDIALTGAAGPIGGRLYDVEEGADRPTLVYFHGGGFVVGDLDSHDALCRRLSHYGRLRVIAVDYRLAPEHPFPAAPDDAAAALADIVARASEFGVDANRVALGGDSAGANLAAVTSREAARGSIPSVRFQLLFYPVTQSVEETPSRRAFAEGYMLTRESMDWFDGHYLPAGVDRRDERISPLLHPTPEGLAPALVVTAGFDPLKDEGRAYAEALSAAGVSCRHIDYGDQIHGFVSFTAFSGLAEDAIAEAARAVSAALR